MQHRSCIFYRTVRSKSWPHKATRSTMGMGAPDHVAIVCMSSQLSRQPPVFSAHHAWHPQKPGLHDWPSTTPHQPTCGVPPSCTAVSYTQQLFTSMNVSHTQRQLGWNDRHPLDQLTNRLTIQPQGIDSRLFHYRCVLVDQGKSHLLRTEMRERGNWKWARW